MSAVRRTARPGGANSVPRNGTVIGTVAGPVTSYNEMQLRLGPLVMTGSVVLTVVAFAVGMAVGGAAFLKALVAPFALLLMFVFLYQLMLGAWVGRAFGKAGRSTLRLTSKLARTAARTASTAAKAGVANRPRTGARQVPAHRFAISRTVGRRVDCFLVGSLSGPPLQAGQLVRVSGRRTLNNRFRARRVEILAAPGGPVVATVTARVPGRWQDVPHFAGAAFLLYLSWEVLAETVF